MIPCGELNQTKVYLLQQFKNCKTLKAEDMQLFVEYVNSVGLCVETGGGGLINLDYIPAEDQGTVTNTAGTSAVIPLATEEFAGLLSPQEKEKIDTAIQPGDNISELNNDSGFISSVDWDEITGDQSDVNLSGFTNDSEYITLEDIPPQQFEEDITVSLSNGKTMGKYLNGETIPAQGKTFEEVLRDIAIEKQFPTFVNPTFSLAHNQGTRETGASVNLTLTANFNRGQILGDIVGGIWNPSTVQNFRAGVVEDYIIDGTNTGLTNTKNIPTYVVTLGTNSFSSTVNYSIGSQPLDSSGNNYSTPYPAGNMTANVQFTGLYPYFWGVIEPDEDIEDINLSSLTKVVATSTGTITIPYSGVSSKRLVIMTPSTSTTKTVWWVNALNNGGIGNPGDLFPEVETESYNSPSSFWSGINYKVYISTPTDLNTNIELRNN